MFFFARFTKWPAYAPKKHREPWHKVSMVDEALDAKQSAKLGAQQDVPESAATWEANSLNHFGS